MKKIIVAALAGLICFCFSCNDTATSDKGSDTKQKNIAASDAISRAFETGNVSAIDSFIADDFIDHTDRGDFKGRDSLKAMVKFVHDNMKDMKTEKLHELADDEYVFSWMRWTGTSNGAGGMPSGPYDMHAMEVSKFKDGKAIEHWTYMDAQEMMKMMGAMQQGTGSDMNHSTDTSKTK